MSNNVYNVLAFLIGEKIKCIPTFCIHAYIHIKKFRKDPHNAVSVEGGIFTEFL